ncbi:MAG: hypothetical protein AUG75_05540 [Cyanobacteria bacterium 13_1_20CM_4_61_6]|nr:MAG: hypothetical protein AUG75_05540 [Cyanobacteria bacterium 13_1_20CM_4_61_6]
MFRESVSTAALAVAASKATANAKTPIFIVLVFADREKSEQPNRRCRYSSEYSSRLAFALRISYPKP